MFGRFFLALTTAIAFSLSGAIANEHSFVSYSVTGGFDDVVFELENAIVDEGLVIDYRGHVNAMLERTSEVVGNTADDGAKSPYIDATYMHFCSAALTHEAVSADVENLAICPYVIFAYELKNAPGTTYVGYRRPMAGSSPESLTALGKIEALLDSIVKSASGE